MHDHPNLFPPSYLPKLDLGKDGWHRVIRLGHYTWQEILGHFAQNPTKLAVVYVTEGSQSLSEFEQARIWAEGTMETVRYLIQHLPPTDPVLVKLAKRWDFSLNPSNSFLI